MRRSLRPCCAAVIAVLGACARAPRPDTGLNTDVALADQLARQHAPALQAVPQLAAEAIPAANPPEARTTVARRAPQRPAPSQPTPTAPSSATAVRGAMPARVDVPAGGEVVASGPADAMPVANVPSEDGAVARRASYPGTGEYGAPVASPAPRPQAHVARDATLGTLAGAILGAVANSHDRVRGGLIGAVAGGALGAVYGSSVDRSYPRTYASGIPGGTRVVRRSRYPGTI